MFHGPIPAERYYSYLTCRDIDTMPNKTNVILIQPIGAIEQHGAHLPLITDDAIGLQVIGKTLEQFSSCDNPVVYVLPPQHSGRSTEHISFPGGLACAWVTKDLSQSGVVGDPTGATQDKGEKILASLIASFKKLLEEIDVFHF
ncbi:unnamed protein product [Rotaria sp. Silwood1]|nr:unnamed protein product [Rotaria sp. Silwood1]CAF4664897.1 unnamed protein product [Rotaria sp. Silwood1]CAF4777433.1 unnamed protein product [Rotaria sp. Silwood1]CAF4886360.1 unnamed protein product [Rotaria sp. Silwood1]